MRLQSVTVGRVWKQECQGSAASEQREMDADAQLTCSCLFSLEPQSMDVGDASIPDGFVHT